MKKIEIEAGNVVRLTPHKNSSVHGGAYEVDDAVAVELLKKKCVSEAKSAPKTETKSKKTTTSED